MRNNKEVLLTRKQSATNQTLPKKPLEVNLISTLITMKAEDVDPQMFYKIKARVTNITTQGFRTTSGCSYCGRGIEGVVGDKFLCVFNKKPAAYIAKMYLDFVSVDSSGNLALCAQTRAVEMILKTRAYLISTMDADARKNLINGIKRRLMLDQHHFGITFLFIYSAT